VSSKANVSLCSSAIAGAVRQAGWRSGRSYSKGANLFELRDGRVVGLTVYLGLERALADLGLGHA
jgi:hypothetical protein